MRIGFVKVFVTDLKKSVEFYTKTLGMELDYTDEKNWAQFCSGEEISFSIEQVSPDHTVIGNKVVGRFSAVTFMLDNIAELYEKLSANGVAFTGKPEKMHWGGIVAHLKDLDGNILTLMQES